MANWQQYLKRIFANHKPKDSGHWESNHGQSVNTDSITEQATLQLDDAAMVKLMHCLEMTMENACSCAEAFALLDEYTELVASDEQAQQLMPLVKNHMDICPDCREEFEVLLTILETERSDEGKE